MLLESIDFEKFEKRQWKLDWGVGDSTVERSFYCSEGLIYKIWGDRYRVKDYIIDKGQYVSHHYNNPEAGIASIDVGLTTKETCPALVDLIWDSQKRCRGYVMQEGKPL